MPFLGSSQESESITLPRLAASMGFFCKQNEQKNWVIMPRDNAEWLMQQQPDQQPDQGSERWLLVTQGVPQILMQKQEAIAFLKRQKYRSDGKTDG